MFKENTALYWEKKYNRLQRITGLYTFLGTLIGCVATSYFCENKDSVTAVNNNPSEYAMNNFNSNIADTVRVENNYTVESKRIMAGKYNNDR